jgi:hypothetical protein
MIPNCHPLIRNYKDDIIIISSKCKKSLKISKGLSEAVNRRRTENTMAKRKRTNNNLQNLTQKTKDPATLTQQTNTKEFV